MKKVFLWSGVMMMGTMFLAGCNIGNSSITKEKINNVSQNNIDVNNRTGKSMVSKVFLVALDGGELAKSVEGEKFGCDDKLLSVEFEAMSPQQSVEKLFTYNDKDPDLYNSLAINETPLQVESLAIDDSGLATLKIKGEAIGVGTCDMPRVTQQLRATLTQFENINEVKIYFNDKPLEEYLSGKGNETVLLPADGDEIFFGAFPDFGGPEDSISVERIEKFNNLVGKRIFWAYFSNNWGKNRDGLKFPREKIEVIAETGAIPFVRMMPRQIFDTAYDKTFSLQKIIDGNFDDALHQYAKDVADYGDRILIDFGLEMNGNWFPWSGAVNGGGVKTKYGNPEKADGPERFIDAYRHVVDIFREENVENVTWFWHHDVYSEPNVAWNQPKEYYPGDDYVDWVGISAYGPQNPEEDYWDSFATIMAETQKNILAVPTTKPRALLEFGVTDHHPLGRKSTWLAGAFKYILDKNSPVQFKAISPWHENWEEDDDLWATIRLDSSPGATAVFKKQIANPRFIGAEEMGDY